MKIFSSAQTREIDDYTIKNEPIKSIDLMERAATELYAWVINNYDRKVKIYIVAGPGNNGGDGLAMARMLADSDYDVNVVFPVFSASTSKDFSINKKRLLDQGKCKYSEISSTDEFPETGHDDIIIDAIFGSGLSRPVEGFPAEIIKEINNAEAEVVSVDVPSGLFGESNTDNIPDNIIRADYTLTIQFPKLSFFFAENYSYVGRYFVIPIGLHPEKIRMTPSNYSTIDAELVLDILKERSKFDHKGNFGHGLMVAGSCGKAGAAILSSHAALRSGIGLLTAHVPRPVADIINSSLPEAMTECDQSEIMVTEVRDPGLYDAIGIGPGLGTKPNTKKGLRDILGKYDGPLVLDADAINIISLEKDLMDLLPENSVLTPHPGEFSRLSGSDASGYDRLREQVDISEKYKCIIVLKGACSSISLPDGRVWFNTTGNPGMATAGSGDVLTGMILSFLAQGYPTGEAAIAAVYLHGLAGDIAAEKKGYESLIASDIIYNIGNSFQRIRQ